MSFVTSVHCDKTIIQFNKYIFYITFLYSSQKFNKTKNFEWNLLTFCTFVISLNAEKEQNNGRLCLASKLFFFIKAHFYYSANAFMTYLATNTFFICFKHFSLWFELWNKVLSKIVHAAKWMTLQIINKQMWQAQCPILRQKQKKNKNLIHMYIDKLKPVEIISAFSSNHCW